MSTAPLFPDPPLQHLFDGDTTNVYLDEVCNLCAGTPGPDLLRPCADMFQAATQHRMEHEKKDAFLFQYGAAPGPWDFRQELSRFLTRRYQDTVHREDLVLTCGATHGLQLALNSFVEPDGVILVEEVTYMIALSVFKEYSGMKVVPVPFSSTGVVPEELDRLARREKALRTSSGTAGSGTGKPFWAVFYTIPVHHNPTGVSASQEVLEAVVRTARALDLLVMCDDVYNLLHYDDEQPAPRRLFSVERALPGDDGEPVPARHVVSNGSFSKILAPGVRVGWLEAPGPLALRLRNSGLLKSGGGVNAYTAGVLTSAMQLGLLDKNLDNLVSTFKGRMRVLCDTLEAELGAALGAAEGWLRRPAGGYFVWLQLPDWVDGQQLHRFARDSRRVAAFPGTIFSFSGQHGHCLRLAIAFHDELKLAAAGRALSAAILEYIRLGGQV